jgi:uncharacterized protein (DUF433 family)
MPQRTMRSWFLGKRPIFKPSYHRGDSVLLSFNDVTEAYIVEVLRSHYDFHPTRLRAALKELRKRTRLERPLIQRELYAIPEFQSLVAIFPVKGKKSRECVDLAHNQNLVFEDFVSSLGKRIQRDRRGRACRLYPWREASSDDAPVSIDPNVVSGDLVVTGTRIPAHVIVASSNAGKSAEDIARSYDLSTDLIEKVLLHFERKESQKAS